MIWWNLLKKRERIQRKIALNNIKKYFTFKEINGKKPHKLLKKNSYTATGVLYLVYESLKIVSQPLKFNYITE